MFSNSDSAKNLLLVLVWHVWKHCFQIGYCRSRCKIASNIFSIAGESISSIFKRNSRTHNTSAWIVEAHHVLLYIVQRRGTREREASAKLWEIIVSRKLGLKPSLQLVQYLRRNFKTSATWKKVRQSFFSHFFSLKLFFSFSMFWFGYAAKIKKSKTNQKERKR